jgi:hypothetical protein
VFARKLSPDNDYSLAAIERDLLVPLNLKFQRDKSGEIADLKSSRAGVEGSLAIESTTPEGYTPKQLLRALVDAASAEKEFMRTGERKLTAGENPKKDNLDYERAEILANLLTGESLETLATRGLHGGQAGNREDKINAVIDYLYKGSYGRDLYTNTPILGAASDQGHLESNSRGGVRLRPELALINQMLGDSEGAERLARIDQAKRRIRAAGSFNDKIMNDKDIQNLMQYKDFQNMIEKQPERAIKYGYVSDEPIIERFAGENELARAIMGSEAGQYAGSSREGSPGENTDRALNIRAMGDVTIGQDVLRAGNSNSRQKNKKFD